MGQDTSAATTVEPYRFAVPSAERDFRRPMPIDWQIVKRESDSRAFQHLTLETFGVVNGPVLKAYEFSPAHQASLFNLHGLECPRCAVGPTTRTRSTIPPFGARATFQWKRLEVYGQAAALEAFRPEGTSDITKQGVVGSSSYHDAWLAQAEVGAKVAVDRDRHLWLDRAAMPSN